jgi:hypothetical protein
MKVLIRIAYLPFIIIFAVSCTQINKGSSIDEHLNLDIPSKEINTRILLAEPAGLSSLKIGDILNIMLKNISKDTIMFTPDYGIRVFEKQTGNWAEIKNDVGNPNVNLFLPPKGGTDPGLTIIYLNPALRETRVPVDIYVVVIGTVYNNGQPTPIKTGASILLTLQP